MRKWAAGIEYAEGKLGRVGIYGLDSREAAIAWLHQDFNDSWWRRHLHMMPSMWVREIER